MPSTQYPASTATIRYPPTLAGYKVKKFKPSSGFEEVEKLKDETGVPFLYNGVNLEYHYDIEMYVLAGYTTPVQLTKLVFTASALPNAAPYPGQYAGSISILVESKPTESQDEAGKVELISFTGVTSANIP
jgi:hypothetical protein